MRPVGPDLGELLMSSIAQSVSCMVNVIDDQCASSLALKAFRDGAQATSAGSPFQSFMTREANAFLRTRDAAGNFMSFLFGKS